MAPLFSQVHAQVRKVPSRARGVRSPWQAGACVCVCGGGVCAERAGTRARSASRACHARDRRRVADALSSAGPLAALRRGCRCANARKARAVTTPTREWSAATGPLLDTRDAPSDALPAAVLDFVADRRVLLVTFGSLHVHASVGLDVDLLLRELLRADDNLRVIYQGGDASSESSHTAVAGADASGRLLRLPGFVSHAALLPKCAAILHHGGAGTVQEAARCVRLQRASQSRATTAQARL
jgi:hypothetical protein